MQNVIHWNFCITIGPFMNGRIFQPLSWWDLQWAWPYLKYIFFRHQESRLLISWSFVQNFQSQVYLDIFRGLNRHYRYPPILQRNGGEGENLWIFFYSYAPVRPRYYELYRIFSSKQNRKHSSKRLGKCFWGSFKNI